MFGLSGTTKKQIVGLAVTPNLGIEACVYNKDTKEFVKYGKKFLEYNIASREIQEVDAFRGAVSDLLDELEISKNNANLFLVLPNVHFGFRNVNSDDADDEAIESMILSDASESYIFKQTEPISAWVDVNANTGAISKYIAHTSIQGKVVEAIQDAIMDIGGNLVGIESSTSAIPRGIALTGLCDKEIENNEKWDILLINPNNYAIFQMCGERILDYIEVPFAIMSFENDEVYSALSSAIAQYLPNYPAKKLVVTSFTDNVSAELLKSEIIFDEEIIHIDSNKNSSSPIVNVSETVIKQIATSMSLSALGAAVPKFKNFSTLNVMRNSNYDGVTLYGKIPIKDKTIEITSDKVFLFGILTGIACIVLAALICIPLMVASQNYSGKIQTLSGQIKSLEGEVSGLKKQVETNIITLIKQISENNKTSLKYYDSLSTDIPTNVWLTYYTNIDGKNVGIEGYSLEINDIYEYFKSLKLLSPTSDIKLNKLEVFQEEVKNETEITNENILKDNNEQQTFYFEISNTKYSKSFDENGNKTEVKQKKKVVMAGPPEQQQSFAAKIPNIPDVEINLKEIK